MMKLMSCIFIFFVLVMIFHSRQILCEEIENEHEFSYVQGSKNGPENWGDLHPEWAACRAGRMQSPIDLSRDRIEVTQHLKKLKRNYNSANTTIVNRGHDVMLTWIGGGGTFMINNTEYVLRQCHWHSPSEHTLNGKRFALELHMVHQSADNKTAVIGITYTYGRPDTFLTKLMEHIEPIVSVDNHERPVGVLNPKDIKMGSRKYYRYIGSLTTPPCTENVVWTIAPKVRTVSRDQIRLLRSATGDTNARPVQKLNQRSIHLYKS